MLYSLPKLTDDKSFENLCCDIMKTKSPLGFTVYGRNGQKQNGVDIFPTISGRPYIQCKNYQDKDKKTKDRFIEEITDDYNTAISTYDDCKQFWVFTALNSDVYIINKIKYLSNDNKPIVPFFWEDITKEIIYHPDLLRIYFPFFFNQENFKFIIGEEEKLIIDIQRIIKDNIKIIKDIDLFTNKSLDLYEAEDLLYALVSKIEEHSIKPTQSTNYIIDFVNILNNLLTIMAINSNPLSYNPEVRCPNKYMCQETIVEFNNLKESAKNYASIILKLPTKDN